MTAPAPPKLLRPAARDYRAFAYDARRWAGYVPRADDIVIATYPKCGTTWMQRLVSMLVFASIEPRPLAEVSPWIDRRFGADIATVHDRLAAQTHRRFIKSHLPLDALPLYDSVKYVHVARDGRDACMSFHNHSRSFTPEALANFDAIGLADETIGRTYPRGNTDFETFYRDWIAETPWATTTCTLSPLSFFDFELTFWRERARDNVLLVHYNDLKQDLAGELRRLAKFLAIELPEALWPAIVEAGDFNAMRRDGDRLMPEAAKAWQGGADTFLHKGTNGRWRDLLTPEDAALYETKADAELPPDCADWLANGRLGASNVSAP